MNALYLAFAYLRFHWARSLGLVLVAALILFVRRSGSLRSPRSAASG
ncbi:MAG: hypothetical protein AAF322_16450 [Pseudomonadota bacterium]